MKKAAFLLSITIGFTYINAFGKLACPKNYQALITCKNLNAPMKGFEAFPLITADSFVLCQGAQSPAFMLVSSEPMDANLQSTLSGVDDGMFARNGFGVFTDNNELIIANLAPTPEQGLWVLSLGSANEPVPPSKSSKFNCQQ